MIALHAAHVSTNAHQAQFLKATNTQSTQTYVLIAVHVQTFAHRVLSTQVNNLQSTNNQLCERISTPSRV